MPTRKAKKGSPNSTPNKAASPSLEQTQNSFVAALQGLTRENDVHILPVIASETSGEAQEPAWPYKPTEGDDEDESDDDAPEAVSLKTGRKAAEEDEKRVREFEARTAAKRKSENKKRDRALKERAEVQGGGRKKRKAAQLDDGNGAQAQGPPSPRVIALPPSDGTVDIVAAEEGEEETAWEGITEGGEDSGESASGENSAEARMRRAMLEAEEEDGDDADDGADEEVIRSSEGRRRTGQAPTHLYPDMNDEEDDGQSPSTATRGPPQRLPDHVFASAAATFAQARDQQEKLKRKSGVSNQSQKAKAKKHKAKPSVKERVIGSTTVRVLSSKTGPDAGGKAAIAAQRFVRQKLSLTKADATSPKKKKNSKGWERKEAHLTLNQGTMAPARGFARSTRAY